MASERDELLLQVRAVVEGLPDVRRLNEEIASGIARQNAAMRQQAAVSAQTASAVGRLQDTADRGIGMWQRYERMMYGVAAGAATAFGAFQSMKSILDAGADYAKWETSFRVMLGGAEAATKQLEYLTEYAAKTPFTLPQVIESSKLMEALGLNTKTYLGVLGDVSAFMDRDLKDAVLAVGNAMRGEYENLKGFGVNIESVFERANLNIRSGGRRTKETNEAVVAALMDMWREKFGGGMEALSKTTTGKLSNIEDAWWRFKLRISQSGVGDVFTGQLQQILDAVDRLEKDGTLAAWAKNISDGMSFAFRSIEGTGRALVALKEPLIFLAGAFGLNALGLAAQGAAVKLLAASSATTAWAGTLTILRGVLAALGGPLGVALFLLGGLAAISLTRAAGEIDKLREAHARLDAELGRAAGREAAPTGGDMAGTIRGLKEAEERARSLKQWIDQMALRGADVRILGGAQRELDTALATVRRLREERDGLLGREAGFAPPVDAVRMGLGELSKTYGFRPGETTDDVRKRAAAVSAPPAEDPAAAAKKKTLSEEERKRLADEAKRAAEAARRTADAIIREAERTAEATTRVYTAGLERRLDLLGAEGAERVALMEKFGREELATLTGSAEAYFERRAALEQEFDRRLALLRATSMSEATRARMAADLEAERARARAGLEAAFASGKIANDARAALDAALEAERAAAARAGAAERARLELESARSERDLTGQTTREYLANLERRMRGFREHDAAYRALLKERADFERRMQEEREANIAQTRERNPRLSKDQAGVIVDERERSAERAREEGELTKQYLADAEAAINLFFDRIGARWNEFIGAGRAAFALMTGFGGGFYSRMRFEADLYFKHHRTSQNMMVAVLRSALREGTAAMLDALAARAAAQAKEYGARALAAAGEALLFGSPSAAAAALKFGAAAAALGAASAFASAGAANIRAGEQREREEIQRAMEARDALASDASAGTSARAPDARTLAITAADRTIIQNIYVSTSFNGGAIVMGRDSAQELVDALIPGIQDALDSGALRAPRAAA